MIDAKRLLTDLERLRAELEDDLGTRCNENTELDAAFREQYHAAREAGRTGETYALWRDERLTQVAIAWILGCVFIRFLEDNELIDPPRLSGPGSVVSGRSTSTRSTSARTPPRATASTCSTCSARSQSFPP